MFTLMEESVSCQGFFSHTSALPSFESSTMSERDVHNLVVAESIVASDFPPSRSPMHVQIS